MTGATISFVSSTKGDDQLLILMFELHTAFKDLKRVSVAVVNSLAELVSENEFSEKQQCVGLICPSSEDFLFAWLGLMRAGFSVLLIA
jgi:acyl-CoA synthetase (AMP-forming)/AMP-acid ligase II